MTAHKKYGRNSEDELEPSKDLSSHLVTVNHRLYEQMYACMWR